MEEAANWLIEQEHALQRTDVDAAQAALLSQSTQQLAPFSTQTAGVAGILRREQQLAAPTDRHALLLTGHNQICSCHRPSGHRRLNFAVEAELLFNINHQLHCVV